MGFVTRADIKRYAFEVIKNQDSPPDHNEFENLQRFALKGYKKGLERRRKEIVKNAENHPGLCQDLTKEVA